MFSKAPSLVVCYMLPQGHNICKQGFYYYCYDDDTQIHVPLKTVKNTQHNHTKSEKNLLGHQKFLNLNPTGVFLGEGDLLFDKHVTNASSTWGAFQKSHSSSLNDLDKVIHAFISWCLHCRPKKYFMPAVSAKYYCCMLLTKISACCPCFSLASHKVTACFRAGISILQITFVYC